MSLKRLRQLEFEGQNTEKGRATKKKRSRELYEWLNVHSIIYKAKSPDAGQSATSREKHNYESCKANYPRAHKGQGVI